MTDCEREVEFAERLTKTEQVAKSCQHRLDDVEQRQDALDKLAESMARMDERQSKMDTDVKEIKSDVKTLADKPGKRWDKAVDTMIGILVGALIAFLSGGVAG